MQEIRILIH